MFAYCNNNPVIAKDPSGKLLGVLIGIGVGIALLLSGCDSDSNNREYAGRANCYAYAFMMSEDPRTGQPFDHKPQPGEFSGKTYTERIRDIKNSQSKEVTYAQIKTAIIDSVEADGYVNHYNIEEVSSADYPTKDGQWLVALAYESGSNNYNYHWWRKMPGGTWCHKPGLLDVMDVDFSGNPISDPKNCDRDNYDIFFGYFLITPND